MPIFQKYSPPVRWRVTPNAQGLGRPRGNINQLSTLQHVGSLRHLLPVKPRNGAEYTAQLSTGADVLELELGAVDYQALPGKSSRVIEPAGERYGPVVELADTAVCKTVLVSAMWVRIPPGPYPDEHIRTDSSGEQPFIPLLWKLCNPRTWSPAKQPFAAPTAPAASSLFRLRVLNPCYQLVLIFADQRQLVLPADRTTHPTHVSTAALRWYTVARR